MAREREDDRWGEDEPLVRRVRDLWKTWQGKDSARQAMWRGKGSVQQAL